MSIRNAKNFNRSLKKLNSSYSNEVTDSTETSSSLGLKGLLKRGMNQQAIQLEISAAAGQGGAGSPRGGRCSGGNGGGGGGGLVRYTTNTFDTIPYSIGASGTPRGGGGEESQPSAAPSGTGTLVFGYPLVAVDLVVLAPGANTGTLVNHLAIVEMVVVEEVVDLFLHHF